jgi:hypothetical protein
MESKQEDVKVIDFNVDKREKTNTTLTPITKNGKLCYIKRIHLFKKIDGYWKKAKITESTVSFDEVHGDEFKDKLTVDVVVRRTALDPLSLKNVNGYFKSSITVETVRKNDKLSVVDGKVFLHTFAPDLTSFTQPICPMIKSELYEATVSKKEERIGETEARELAQKGVMFLEEDTNAKNDANRYAVGVVHTRNY